MSSLVQSPASESRPRGRPRSTERQDAILESTRTLLASGTYEQLTVEAIAAGAGVSKQTVYKWWPSKAAVVAEAVIAGYLHVGIEPLPDTGDVAADLRTWMHLQITGLGDPTGVALVRAMTAASAEGNDSERLFEELAQPHRQNLLRRLSIAEERGQIRVGSDLEAAVDALISTLLLRALSGSQTIAHRRADGLIDLFVKGMIA